MTNDERLAIEDLVSEREEQLAKEYRFREACELYPHLEGVAEAVANSRRAQLAIEVEWREAELLKLKEEQVRLDEPDFSYSDSVSDFAERFIEWIDSGCPIGKELP